MSFAWKGQDELWVATGSRFYRLVNGVRNCGTQRLWIRGMTKAPYKFYLFAGKSKGFGDVEEGGQSLDTRGVD